MSDDEYTRVTFRVPVHVKDAAKRQTEHGELSERVRSLFQQIAFGKEVEHQESLQEELENVRQQIDEIDAVIRDKQSERETLRQQETRLEEKLNATDSRKQKYEGHLESLESMLLNGAHIDPSHPVVEDAAAVLEMTTESVIEDLQDRNPAVPDYAYVPMNEAEREWTGTGGDR